MKIIILGTLFFIALIAVVSFASSVNVTTVNLQTNYGALTYMYSETGSGPAGSTPSTNTALTPTSSSGSYSIAQGSTAYLWSPQFGSATTISAGNWILGLWAASGSTIAIYVPITITNSQSTATPSAFQEEITWNPSSYMSYEASNLGNIRFYSSSAFTTPLYAWLESCTPSLSNTAISATAWVKLTSSIAASGGTLTIYMAFLSSTTNFDGNYWGDAPNLLGTYGAYDNGAQVFNAYFNGNTALSSFSVYSGYTLAQATSVSGPGSTTINAIKATGYQGNNVVFSFNKAMSNTALIVESSFSSPGSVSPGTDTGVAGLVNNAAASSVTNAISANTGYTNSGYGVYFDEDYMISSTVTRDNYDQGTASSSWLYATLTYTGSAASSWSAYVAPQLYSSTGGYSGTLSNNPLSSATNLYLGQISGTSSTYPITIYYNYIRARTYPPNGVMPTASFGSLNVCTTPTLPSGVLYYVPVTLTNSQTTAVSGGSQVSLTMDWATYESYLDNPVDNYEFFNSAGTTMYSWLESGTANTATSALLWLKLDSNGIPASGSYTIYLGFTATGTSILSPTGATGEAPQLSSTYGAYDNGAQVFNAYFNGNTALSSFSVYSGYTLAQATSVSGPGSTTINAIKATGYNGRNAVFSFNTLLSNTALIVESSFSSPGSVSPGTDTGVAGLVNNAAASSVTNAISADMGHSGDYFDQDYEISGTVTNNVNPQGTSTSSWLYATLTYTGSAASSWSAYVAPQLYSSTGGYSGTLSNNPLSSATNLYLGQISSTSSTSSINIYYNYMRARAYPPNNVMPSVSFGSVSSAVNTLSVSIYTTTSTGNIQSTVASNIQSPTIGNTEAQHVMELTGSQVTVPQNGYITIMLSATQTASYIVYWGQGEPTNFQVPYSVLT